ncbi:hypothetical protein CASFOL_008280 [Castilleja foliolosa]|uniref:Uncharacterized protein n=1 Tax=Castilleja foliolosa TaxID=1961234 RepID=A0ABD3E069_9LAMI
MSLRKSGSEAEIIDHRTDNGDYGPEIKSKQEDKTFQDVVSDFGICHPEILSKPKSPTVSRPDVLSGFVDYHPYILSKRKSGWDNDIIYDGIFSGPDENKAGFDHTWHMEKTAPQYNLNSGLKPRHCGACGGGHDFWFCPLRWTCKFDQKVGEDYEIVCNCSTPRCSGRCSSLVGRVRMKRMVEF